jgi:hypothetical protein
MIGARVVEALWGGIRRRAKRQVIRKMQKKNTKEKYKKSRVADGFCGDSP